MGNSYRDLAILLFTTAFPWLVHVLVDPKASFAYAIPVVIDFPDDGLLVFHQTKYCYVVNSSTTHAVILLYFTVLL